MSLYWISNQLKIPNCWAFSTAFYGATVISSSYIDLRVRFFDGVQLRNYHIRAILIYVCHKDTNMFEIISKCLSSLCAEGWKAKLIGAPTDGADHMVGGLSGAVKSTIEQCQSGISRVWCGAHQLDLAVQSVFEDYMRESFQDSLNAIIKYFRRQTNLVTKMETQCSKVAMTKWLSIGTVGAWFIKQSDEVKSYFYEKKPNQCPDST